MDKQAFVHRRKKRYMAQLLEHFEETIEPLVPKQVAEEFKGMTRRKLHALALDACEVMALDPGEEINGSIIELRDRMHAEGRPVQRRTSA